MDNDLISREWSCQDCRWCYYNCKDHSIACEQEDGICDDFEIWKGDTE